MLTNTDLASWLWPVTTRFIRLPTSSSQAQSIPRVLSGHSLS